MPEIRTDRRTRRVDPDPKLMERVHDVAQRYLDDKRELAKLLAEVEVRGMHLPRGFSSVRDFARLALRLPGYDAAQLLNLGRALGVEASHVAAQGCANAKGEEADGGESQCLGSEEREVAGELAATAGGADGEVDGGSATVVAPAPAIETRVAQEKMSFENAAILGELFNRLGTLSNAKQAEWTELAEDVDARELRRRVRQALEEAAQREHTVPLALHVTESARDAFHRAQRLASRRARRWLTEGQVFALVVRRYIRDEDERLVGEKKRRKASTSRTAGGGSGGRSNGSPDEDSGGDPVLGPGDRYIPAQVRRDIRKRADDRCEVPGCSNGTFLEFMHVQRAHRDGGSREIDNLALGCTTHHVLLDAGVIRFQVWRDGLPVFIDSRGREIDYGRRRRSVERERTADTAREQSAKSAEPDPWPLESEPGAGQVAERPPPWGAAEERRTERGRDSVGAGRVGCPRRWPKRVLHARPALPRTCAAVYCQESFDLADDGGSGGEPGR